MLLKNDNTSAGFWPLTFRLFLNSRKCALIIAYSKPYFILSAFIIKTSIKGLSWYEKLKNLISRALPDEGFMLLNETQFV